MEIFLVVFVVIIIMSILIAISNNSVRKTQLKSLNITELDLIQCGKYTAGHPDIDKPINFAEVLCKDNELLIYGSSDRSRPVLSARIPIEKIKNIILEDASTVQKRVTVTRLLSTGLFAFALKKKEKTETAYIIIEWNDGKFDHETIFEFSNLGAVQKANETRNKLVKLCR